MQELQIEDTNGLKEMMRMDYKSFKEIINLVEPDIIGREFYRTRVWVTENFIVYIESTIIRDHNSELGHY